MAKAKVAKKKIAKAQKPVCKRCGFGSKGPLWISRPGRLALSGRTRPERCPQCKSKYWDSKPSSKPNGKKLVAKAKSKKPATSKKPTTKKRAAPKKKPVATEAPPVEAV